MNNHKKIFKNSQETPKIVYKTSGTIPDWLSGDLYRNSPGLFDLKKQSVNHWFDGMGLLHHFNINNNTTTYQSKFIQSESYNYAIKNQIDTGNLFRPQSPFVSGKCPAN